MCYSSFCSIYEIIFYVQSKAEIIDSVVDAPFGIILQGDQNFLLIQNSDIKGLKKYCSSSK